MEPKTYIDKLNQNSHWYALYTRSRYEKKVDKLLNEKGITSYLPLNEVYHRWSDRYKKVLLPLFSCYVFVFIALRDRFKVLQTDGAIQLVTFNGKPATIPEDQINIIKRILVEKLNIDHANSFAPGKQVKVIKGPLKGFNGTLIHRNNKNRLVIAIDGIKQALSIEIDYRDLQII